MKTGIVLLSMTLVCVTISTGCTHVAKARARTDAQLQEHSRAFTTAVVDALQLQPTDQRDIYTEAALEFAREDQRIEGPSSNPIDAQAWMGLHPTNMPAAEMRARQTAAVHDVENRIDTARSLLAKQRRNEDRLIQFGEQFEEERNTQRAEWFRRGSLWTLIVGGFIALAIFFPAAVPLVGRLLAWVVGKVPSLAGSVGVVGVQAFDAIVKAIEQTRSHAAPEKLGNSIGAAPSDLHQNLSREMDAAHKALVRQRKTALKLGH